MIFRNLDANGDWMFGSGKQNYISGNDAIGLNIRTRLYSWVGDCFFDLAAGIDWKNRLGFLGQKKILEAELRRVILTSFGVTGITSFDTVLSGRRFTCNYAVNTIFSRAFVDSVTRGL